MVFKQFLYIFVLLDLFVSFYCTSFPIFLALLTKDVQIAE